jgi:hypothetical protein
LQKRTHFRENFLRNEDFRAKFWRKRKFSGNEISRKFAYFRIIFAFRENGKNRFRFNPSWAIILSPAPYLEATTALMQMLVCASPGLFAAPYLEFPGLSVILYVLVKPMEKFLAFEAQTGTG